MTIHSGSVFEDLRGTLVKLHSVTVGQMLIVNSHYGVLRGVHITDPENGPTKYVSCANGHILDLMIDARNGSPTFGKCVVTEMHGLDGQTIEVPPGWGHAVATLSDQSTVVYGASRSYDTTEEKAVHPLSVGVDWRIADPILSERDRSARGWNEWVAAAG